MTGGFIKAQNTCAHQWRENNISPQSFHQPAVLQRDKPIVFLKKHYGIRADENAEISLRGLEAHNGDYLFRNSYYLKKTMVKLSYSLFLCICKCTLLCLYQEEGCDWLKRRSNEGLQKAF